MSSINPSDVHFLCPIATMVLVDRLSTIPPKARAFLHSFSAVPASLEQTNGEMCLSLRDRRKTCLFQTRFLSRPHSSPSPHTSPSDCEPSIFFTTCRAEHGKIPRHVLHIFRCAVFAHRNTMSAQMTCVILDSSSVSPPETCLYPLPNPFHSRITLVNAH